MIDTGLKRQVSKIVMGDECEVKGKDELPESLLTQWDSPMYGET